MTCTSKKLPIIILIIIAVIIASAIALVNPFNDAFDSSTTHTHTEVIDKSIEATCSSEGKTEGSHCSVCNEVIIPQEIIPKLPHTEVIDEAIAATCTNEGKTEGLHCSVCQEVIIEQQKTDKLPHTEVIDEAVSPTCTQDGKTKGKHCSVCNEIIIEQKMVKRIPHTEVIDEAVSPTCTKEGKTAGKHCAECGQVTVKQQTIAKVPHTEVIDEAIPATCTTKGKTEGKHCSVCSKILVKQTVTPLADHTPIVDAAVSSTCITHGFTEGSHCSVCNIILVKQTELPLASHTYLGDSAYCSVCGLPRNTDYSNINLYASSYGYDLLASLPNGEAMQNLYSQIDTVAIKFHTDSALNAPEELIVASFNYAELGLTSDEAIAVWSIYRSDHPLYYWISAGASTTSTNFNLLTESEYALGTDRARYNELIYDSVKEYLSDVDLTSPYLVALAAHDKIIHAIDYAYESDGITPQDDIWAHNILGVFEKGSGVCESYAKTFQLLLNFCDIENIFVSGTGSGEGHAWNLAKMDDGNWYWFDLTWDDTPNWTWGVSYNYFCVNDTQSVYLDELLHTYPQTDFMDKHYPQSDLLVINNQNIYTLPDRSRTVFNGSVLRSTFVTDGFEFAIIGHKTVALIGIEKSGKVEIPEFIDYNGTTYSVIAVCGMTSGLFTTDGLNCTQNIELISIPKSVLFIGDRSFSIDSLKYISVDRDNQHFTSVDGVLYTKNLVTLIQFPYNSNITEFIISDETYYLAYGSMDMHNLSSLKIGKNLSMLRGVCNLGENYPDKLGMQINTTAYSTLANSMEAIEIDPANVHLALIDGAVYELDQNGLPKTLVLVLNDIEQISIPDSVTKICSLAFKNCTSLRSITISSSVESIDIYAFLYCYSLTEINFNGTESQWNAIEKESDWDGFTATYTVTCTDGKISKHKKSAENQRIFCVYDINFDTY